MDESKGKKVLEKDLGQRGFWSDILFSGFVDHCCRYVKIAPGSLRFLSR